MRLASAKNFGVWSAGRLVVSSAESCPTPDAADELTSMADRNARDWQNVGGLGLDSSSFDSRMLAENLQGELNTRK